MDHFKRIYASQSRQYQQMIAAEDVDRNLLPALERAALLRNRRVLDLGSGTGRIPVLLQSIASQVMALDLSHVMLLEQQHQRQNSGGSWSLVQGDMRQLPVPTHCADVVIAGWAIGHFIGWFGENWEAQVERVLFEMKRTVVPGGTLIILETMTTGSLKPAPPTQGLADYYTWLETEWGFRREIIQTDYQFTDVETAAAHTEFFFGAELAEKIHSNRWARLPEWTGLWSKNI